MTTPEIEFSQEDRAREIKAFLQYEDGRIVEYSGQLGPVLDHGFVAIAHVTTADDLLFLMMQPKEEGATGLSLGDHYGVNVGAGGQLDITDVKGNTLVVFGPSYWYKFAGIGAAKAVETV